VVIAVATDSPDRLPDITRRVVASAPVCQRFGGKGCVFVTMDGVGAWLLTAVASF